MLALTATAEKWGASSGDVLRCRVELVLHAAPEQSVDASVWVDWLAAQCCGFCTRHSAAAAAEFSVASLSTALATSLPDETQMGVPGRTCFLASAPQVVAAGLQDTRITWPARQLRHADRAVERFTRLLLVEVGGRRHPRAQCCCNRLKTGRSCWRLKM